MFKMNKKTVKRISLIVGIIVLVIALVFGGVYLWLDSALGKTGDLNQNSTYSTDELESLVGPSDELELEPILEQAESILKGKTVVNILLVGQDRREGQSTQRSDAMILCTINQSKKTVTMTSFLRDVWVYIPDHYNQRLNMPYYLGGFDLLNKTLDYNFGVSADYNVEIDFNGFMKAVDLIGGLDIELTAAEAKYLNERGNWDIETNQGWTLEEGVNHLTGSQTLAYSRIRKIGTDFARTNRQRIVLSALIEKAKTLEPTKLYKLVMEILPMVNTDMTTPQVMGLLIDMVPMLSDLNVVSQRIPMKGAYSYAKKNGADVIVISAKNMEKNKALLEETMKDE